MEENKQKAPMQETTKDDSSDIEKVRQGAQGAQAPPPQTGAEQNSTQSSKEQEEEEAEAEKGHS